jgi:hypothetical protein
MQDAGVLGMNGSVRGAASGNAWHLPDLNPAVSV